MSTRTKYIVWIKCRRTDAGTEILREERHWEEQGDGPLTLLQAERISREIKADFDCATRVLPVGILPIL